MERKNFNLLLTAILLLLAAIGCASASYLIISNTVNVSTTPQATLWLSTNATSVVSGVSCIELTAHISDNTPGLTVTFYQDSISIGTAVTNTLGNAILVTPILTESHDYYAEVLHP